MRDDTPEVSVAPPQQTANTALDMSAFAQLIAAAQQTGLGLNVDLIHSVRDHEFREGKYEHAYAEIERLHVQLSAQATQRQAELRRQEMQYKSGTLKMSPKEWLLRQRRETEQTQKIDRARRQFTRVLDGLTVLRGLRGEGE
jgi:hypothetical protein